MAKHGAEEDVTVTENDTTTEQSYQEELQQLMTQHAALEFEHAKKHAQEYFAREGITETPQFNSNHMARSLLSTRKLEMETTTTTTTDGSENNEQDTKPTARIPHHEDLICPVCVEELPKNATKFARLVCCGKGLHPSCMKEILKSNMTQEQKDTCVMCRAKIQVSLKKQMQRIHKHVKEKKAWAQNMLAEHYEAGDGFGITQSSEKAMELFHQAAEQGDIGSMRRIGHLFFQGSDSIARDAKKGRAWMIKAAEHGDCGAVGYLKVTDKAAGRTTPSYVSKPVSCWDCGKAHDPPMTTLTACSKCKTAYYCGRACQIHDWKKGDPTHKQSCKHFQ